MGTPNLISLLRSFSKDEFKEFGKFVRSPYFNSHKDLVNYYIFLKIYYPSFSQPSFTKENAFMKVYPERKFSNREMLKLNSRMNHLGNEFLKTRPENFTDDYKLLGEYLKRNLGKQFNALYKTLTQFVNNDSEIDNLIFVKKIYLESSFIRYNMNKDRQKQICGEIIKRGNYFAYQSLLWIMIQFRDMNANFNAFNFPFEDSVAYRFIIAIDLDKIINEIVYEDNRLGRYLKYYVSCILITIHPDNEKYFEDFRNSFEKIYHEVNRMEKNNYLARLQTFAVKHIQAGNLKYLDELLDAYKYYFENDEIFENGIIPMPPFRSAVLLADFVKNGGFFEELTSKYSLKLNPDFTEDSRNLCLAYRCFSDNNFNNCLEHLKKFSFRYQPHKADVKQLLLKVFYETQEFDSFYSHCDSFRHFLYKNKNITESNKSRYFSFINLSENMYDMRLSPDKKTPSKLQNEINNNKYDLFYFDKRWILEKLNELLM